MRLFPYDWPPYYNGINQPCDVCEGPCICGAWHKAGEFQFKDGTLFRYGKPVATVEKKAEVSGQLPTP